MDLIISHGHCPDGFCAAFIAKKRYPEAEVMFLGHGGIPPYGQVTGKDVLVLDFSWPTRVINDTLAGMAKSFRILDHHKTAQAVPEGADYAVFDMKRSGAGLAWDYLFGIDKPIRPENPMQYERRPWYVGYTEDKDLWNWALPNSKEVCAYLGTLPFTFGAWDSLDRLAITAREAAVEGSGALAHINHYVREVVLQAQTGLLHGYKTAVLNIPYLNCSEVGNALAQTHEVSLTWFERGDGIIQFSLRSIGDIDVSAIAKYFQGGGHKNAAGFQMTLADGRHLVDVVLGRNNA